MCAVHVCVKPVPAAFIPGAEQTHRLTERPQARGNVNMPTQRMAGGRGQEVSLKIIAELLL